MLADFIRDADPGDEQDPNAEVPCPTRYIINCYCGLARCLPPFVELGDRVELVPCPKCGQALGGTFVGNGLEVE